jgi:hypothetical protein
MMKNLLSFSMIALLLLASCKEAQKEEQTTKDEDSSTNDTALIIGCYDSSPIHRDTAEIWFNSWVYAANSIMDEATITNSPDVHFSKDNINLMMPTLKENNGALIYYILRKPYVKERNGQIGNPTPSLALIGTDKCDSTLPSCNQNCVLVSWYSSDEFVGFQEFIDKSLLDGYRKNWTDYLDSIKEAHVKIKGYSYSWSLIYYLLNGDSAARKPKDEIVVKYGVRTLGPGEIDQFVREGEPVDPAVGLPVLCNVILGKDFEVEMADALAATEEYNFAKPCPHYCD